METHDETSLRSMAVRAGGRRFSALTCGSDYDPAGDERPLVLCLHGFPDIHRSFRHQLPALTRAGFRPVAPLLRGYEPSTQEMPGGACLASVASDVLGWMDHLGADSAHLVGHDWGALVGYAVAALAPQRIRTLTAVAVPAPFVLPGGFLAYPNQLRNSWYVAFFQLRGLAETVAERDNLAFIERLWNDWSPGWRPEMEEMRQVKEALRQPGVLRSALAYYRALFSPWTRAGRRSTRLLLQRPLSVPTLAVTGARDGCLDTRLFDRMSAHDFVPGGLVMERIQSAGHFLHQEQPVRFNDLLLLWLRNGEHT